MACFITCSSEILAEMVQKAKKQLIYAAPGMQLNLAKSIAEASRNNKELQIQVIVDPDPEVCRLGYGEIDSLQLLMDSGFKLKKTIGLRIGVIIIDEKAIIFTPTPLLIETSPKASAPNAIQITPSQAKMLVESMSPAVQVSPSSTVKPEPEIGRSELGIADFQVAKRDLENIPPQKFDLARIVRFYTAHIQFVEISLSGCHINRHKITIPSKLLNVTKSEDIQKRIQATYQLIDKSSKLSGKKITESLDAIRKKYLVSLGKNYGSVVLRKNKDAFLKEIENLSTSINDFKNEVRDNLTKEIEKTLKSLAATLAPVIKQNPPSDLTRQVPGKISIEIAKSYALDELIRSLHSVETIINDMKLDYIFKDVTFEMLINEDFQLGLKEKFKYVDWDKPFAEGNAALSLHKPK